MSPPVNRKKVHRMGDTGACAIYSKPNLSKRGHSGHTVVSSVKSGDYGGGSGAGDNTTHKAFVLGSRTKGEARDHRGGNKVAKCKAIF